MKYQSRAQQAEFYIYVELQRAKNSQNIFEEKQDGRIFSVVVNKDIVVLANRPIWQTQKRELRTNTEYEWIFDLLGECYCREV